MRRLSRQTLLPQGVRIPNYDRSGLRPGIVHIGIGALRKLPQRIFAPTIDALAAARGCASGSHPEDLKQMFTPLGWIPPLGGSPSQR